MPTAGGNPADNNHDNEGNTMEHEEYQDGNPYDHDDLAWHSDNEAWADAIAEGDDYPMGDGDEGEN